MTLFSNSKDSKIKPGEPRSLFYRGKAKTLYYAPNNTLIQRFRDTITAQNGDKKAEVKGKGIINNLISELLMTQLQDIGVNTHFIRRVSSRDQLIKRTDVAVVEVVLRNIAAGSLCRRLGLKHGERLARPMIEFFYKNDSLQDPLVSEENIITLGWMTPNEIEEMAGIGHRINEFLNGYFAAIGIRLVDMKLEFGRAIYTDPNDEPPLLLVDEISPDTMRLWDMSSKRILDKDRFRQDLGDIAESYREVASRLGVLASVVDNSKDMTDSEHDDVHHHDEHDDDHDSLDDSSSPPTTPKSK